MSSSETTLAPQMPKEGIHKKRAFHWFHIPAQTVVLGFCVYWYFHLPAPNKAVLILTGVAVVMALLDMHPSHKPVYLLLVIALIFIENRAINKDHADMLKAEGDRRKEQSDKFQTIAQGLKDTIEVSNAQFATTMSKFNATISRVDDSVSTQTGGDSFCYLDFDKALYDVGGMTVTRIGKYPLHGVSAQIMDRAKTQLAVENFFKSHQPTGDESFANEVFAIQRGNDIIQPIPDFATPRRFIGGYQMAKSSWGQSFDILFRAFNGSWIERLEIREVNGKWTKAILVEHHTKAPFLKIDKMYPRKDGKLDVLWPRPVKGEAIWDR